MRLKQEMPNKMPFNNVYKMKKHMPKYRNNLWTSKEGFVIILLRKTRETLRGI